MAIKRKPGPVREKRSDSRERLEQEILEAAKRLLETTPKNINEVLYETGYSDNKSFRMVFKKITGYSPSDYRNRYGHG